MKGKFRCDVAKQGVDDDDNNGDIECFFSGRRYCSFRLKDDIEHEADDDDDDDDATPCFVVGGLFPPLFSSFFGKTNGLTVFLLSINNLLFVPILWFCLLFVVFVCCFCSNNC